MKHTITKPPLSSVSKASYQMSTQSASQKAALSEYRASLRTNDNGGGGAKTKQLPIDIHFEQWNRFENFLKFASKKEIRDRLKEFDPPPMENYVDSDIIDKIKQQGKPPLLKKGNGSSKGSGKSAKEENLERIAKMKQLYGLYK